MLVIITTDKKQGHNDMSSLIHIIVTQFLQHLFSQP